MDLRTKLINRLKYLRQFIREKTKQGYEFKNIPDFKFDKSLKKKRDIQREYKKAQKWTAEKLYKQGTYSGEETYGEVIPASEARQVKREYKKEQEYIPEIELLGWIRDQINELPETRYFKGHIEFNLYNHKNRLLDILNDIEIRIENKKQAEGVTEYLQKISGDLADAFAVITYDSNVQRVEYAVSKVASLLLGRPLSKEEADDFEMIDNENDEIDLTGSAKYFRSILASPLVRL